MIEELNLDILKTVSPLVLAIFVIWQIVKMNLKALNDQRNDFTGIITNHLKHDSELHEKTIETMGNLEKSQQKNTMVMRSMLVFLKNNKKKK